MNEWLNNQNQSSNNFRSLLQERIEKANPRRNLTAEEAKRLLKLEAIAEKLKRGGNVLNRQLQTWWSEDEYAQLELEWQEQLELREELKENLKSVQHDDMQLSFFQLDDPLLEDLREEILTTNLDALTPIEALMKLNEIKRMLIKK